MRQGKRSTKVESSYTSTVRKRYRYYLVTAVDKIKPRSVYYYHLFFLFLYPPFIQKCVEADNKPRSIVTNWHVHIHTYVKTENTSRQARCARDCQSHPASTRFKHTKTIIRRNPYRAIIYSTCCPHSTNVHCLIDHLKSNKRPYSK